MRRLLLLTVVFAAACAKPPPPPPPLARVLVTHAALDPGTVLAAEHLQVLPLASPPPGILLEADAAEILGRRLRIPLGAGEMLQGGFVEPPPARLPIPEGHRIVTLPLRGAEHLVPGDRVDVLKTMRTEPDGELVTLTESKPAQVSAVHHHRMRFDERGESITEVALLVDGTSAILLTEAAALGMLHVAQRNPADTDELEVWGRTTVHTLLSRERMSVLQRVHDRFRAGELP